MEVLPDSVALYQEGPGPNGEYQLLLLKRAPLTASAGEWHVATFDTQGTHLSAILDDGVVAEAKVGKTTQGCAALGMYGRGKLAFDSVVISRN